MTIACPDCGPLATATAGWGAMTFMLMSMFTMIASFTFDPRLMWDAAEAASSPAPEAGAAAQEAPA